MNADGSDVMRLTELGYGPSYPADGKTIVFANTDDFSIYRVDADGSDLTLLNDTAWGESPVVAPAGDKIFFTGGEEDYDIWSMDSDGTDAELLIDRPGTREGYAAISADGTKLAFSGGDDKSSTDDIFVADPDGSDVAKVPMKGTGIVMNYEPVLSPDGSRVAWVRSEDVPSLGIQSSIYISNIDGSGQKRLSALGGGQKNSPEFSPDGTRIVYSEVTDYDSWDSDLFIMDVDGTNVERLTHLPGSEGAPTFAPDSSEIAFHHFTPPDEVLLDAYAPLLKYDAQESYRADSAAEITDNYVASNYTNKLTRSATTLATADPSTAYPTLSLDFLDYPLYADSSTALATDNLDEDNGDYEGDAARLHGDDDYADRSYGRVVRDEGSGQTILQYWYFYYYNPKTWFLKGAHEGDWELVQVHLDDAEGPVEVAAAQHSWGEGCEWEHVQIDDLTHPIIYVAEGSHANYFSSGEHKNPPPGQIFPFVDDRANGDGDSVIPAVENVTDPPAWMRWPGDWGGSGKGSSPVSPYNQGYKWDDPYDWSQDGDEVKDCTEEQLSLRAAPDRDRFHPAPASNAPAPPHVTAHRRGRNVIVRYAFPPRKDTGDRKPWQLLTTVDAAGTRYPPLTKRTMVRASTGVIRQPLGLGAGPYEFRYSVRAKSGASSAVIDLPLTP